MPPCSRKRSWYHGSTVPLRDTAVSVALVAVMGLFAPTTVAFVPPIYQTTTTPTWESSSLFGVRSALRRGFNKIQKPFRRSSPPPTLSTSRQSPNYHHESTSEWHQTSNHGVALLTEEEEQEIQHISYHDRHREVLTAAFDRHSPTMFEHYHHHHHLPISRLGAMPTHHPSENIDDENTLFSSSSSSPSFSLRVRRRRVDFQSDAPLYVLPPRVKSRSGAGTNRNRLEEEFRGMLAHFSNYSMRDLYALRDPRMRTLVYGVAASGDEEAVYRAFEILFEDLIPLRIAGRLVFTRLKNMMEKCIQEREEQIAHVVEATGLDATDVEEARIVFFEVASKLNHDTYLTPEQLTSTRMFHSIHDRLNLESSAELVRKLDRHDSRKIGLEDFLIGLHQCAEDQCVLEGDGCYALQVVHELLEEIDSMENPTECEIKTAKLIAREAKEVKHVMRYNKMVDIFKGWKDQMPGLDDKHGRKWEVVQGCFVGAENQKVVDALRIVYVDYAPLRVAAECILSLAASLLHLKPEVK